MAQRLATVYVKTCLILSEAQMLELIRLFREHQVMCRVMVMENGGQEVVLKDQGADEVTLAFDRIADSYVCKGACTITGPKLTELMRKAMSTYQGDAIVHRVFTGYIMVYHYVSGSVARIIEQKNGQERLVYEYKDTLGQLERLFNRSEVEREIRDIYHHVDHLLDLRIESAEREMHHLIDERLSKLTHRLFALEA